MLMLNIVFKFSREFNAYRHPRYWFAWSKPFNSLENLLLRFIHSVTETLTAKGFGLSSEATVKRVGKPDFSDNLLTTSDNLSEVANPLYIGVLTTLQPFLKKIACK